MSNTTNTITLTEMRYNMAWLLNDDRPIYSQLIEEIEKRIVIGEYQAGSKLPSVRDLAMEASVNPNTMQKALVALEGAGLISTQRTTGRFITEDVEKIKSIKDEIAKTRINVFLESMKQLGYTNSEIVELIKKQ